MGDVPRAPGFPLYGNRLCVTANRELPWVNVAATDFDRGSLLGTNLVDNTEISDFPRMQGALEPGDSKLRELHRTEAAGRTAYVYELTQ